MPPLIVVLTTCVRLGNRSTLCPSSRVTRFILSTRCICLPKMHGTCFLKLLRSRRDTSFSSLLPPNLRKCRRRLSHVARLFCSDNLIKRHSKTSRSLSRNWRERYLSQQPRN